MCTQGVDGPPKRIVSRGVTSPCLYFRNLHLAATGRKNWRRASQEAGVIGGGCNNPSEKQCWTRLRK